MFLVANPLALPLVKILTQLMSNLGVVLKLITTLKYNVVATSTVLEVGLGLP